ncbi:MAG: amino acid ABC transporter substrate-binding protein [Deltaproteobacteria bacterium]|nr:MAG: amino acid ABC transporter substrate-binding protein [Deltaproteobacteria bacterium]
MKRNHLWIAITLIAALVLFAVRETIAQTAPVAGESMLEQVMKRGTLRVGMSTFVPWAMQDKAGNFVGFEIDVANRLAQEMEVKPEFIPTKWSGIIPALLTGKFDIIIGGMGIRPERNLKVNFSIPYDYTGMSIVAHKKMAAGFWKLGDFNNANVSVAARTGTTAAAAAKQWMPKAKLRLFDDESQAIQELLLGRVHGVVASAPLPAFQAIANPDKLFLPLKEDFTREPIGFAIRKGDPDSLNFLDNWIRVVDAEGWLKVRKRYWFATKEWERLLK